MGWEQRGGKRYYYRSKRVNGRVVRIYMGSGAAAEAAAREDAEVAAERQRSRDALARLMLETAEWMAADDAMKEKCDALMAIVMGAAGYHKTRGVWRKKYKKRAAGKGEENG